jgi:hypothetical protein
MLKNLNNLLKNSLKKLTNPNKRLMCLNLRLSLCLSLNKL